MQKQYLLVEPEAANTEKVERVIRQAPPTFAAYHRSSRFCDLEDLAAEAKCIQGNILAAQRYHPHRQRTKRWNPGVHGTEPVLRVQVILVGHSLLNG